MSKEHKADNQSKPKGEHNQGNNERRRRPINNILIYALPIIAAVLSAVAGIRYESHRLASICVIVGGATLCLLAIVLHALDAVADKAGAPPFAVFIETALVGDTRDSTQICCEYNQEFLVPIPLLFFIRVVNLQEIPAQISTLKIDVELTRESKQSPSTWLPTHKVADELPLVWINPAPDPISSNQPHLSLRLTKRVQSFPGAVNAHTLAEVQLSSSHLPNSHRRLTLVGERLGPILDNRPLQPHETARGWVLLDVGEEFNSAPHPFLFRIVLKDTAGHRFTSLDPGPTSNEEHDNIFPRRGISIEEEVELSRYEFKHLAN